MIYRLSYDFENTPLISIDGVELLNKMPNLRPRFLGQSKLEGWVAPEASLYFSEHYKGTEKSPPDVSVWATGVLVLSPKAYELFAAALAKSGEFLPFKLNTEIYHFLNPLYVVPESALNLSAAVEQVDSGVHVGQTGVGVDESFLDTEGVEVFKIPTDKLVSAYCTEAFKLACEAQRLQGLTFDPL